MYKIEREFEISCGHRVFGHKDKHGNPGPCQRLHGHNYKIVLELSGEELDDLGMLVDFSVVKEQIISKIEQLWDHKFLIWEDDPLAQGLVKLDTSVVWTPFNPTAENMAQYILDKSNEEWFSNSNFVFVSKVIIQETSKCKALAFIP